MYGATTTTTTTTTTLVPSTRGATERRRAATVGRTTLHTANVTRKHYHLVPAVIGRKRRRRQRPLCSAQCKYSHAEYPDRHDDDDTTLGDTALRSSTVVVTRVCGERCCVFFFFFALFFFFYAHARTHTHTRASTRWFGGSWCRCPSCCLELGAGGRRGPDIILLRLIRF